MKSVVVGLLAVVWVGALLGGSIWVWLRSRRAGLDEKRAKERRRLAHDRRRPERDLERMVREATSAGAVIVVSRRGSNPTRVTWSDGAVWFFFEDPDRYHDALQRGMASPGVTHLAESPELGSPRPSG